jgi:hypothetical protein
MARPRVKIDVAELEKLYGMQCADEEVAAFFGVSTRTLARRKEVKKFGEVIDRAKARGRVSVRRALFRLAAAGNIASRDLPGQEFARLQRHSEQRTQRTGRHSDPVCKQARLLPTIR